jgi:hypothetical protein
MDGHGTAPQFPFAVSTPFLHIYMIAGGFCFLWREEIPMDWGKTMRGLLFILACSSAAFPGVTLDDFAVGATYRMTLTTGDVLEGVVDSKNDTSLVLDCKGSAYTFAPALISEYQLLAPPPQKTAGQTGAVVLEKKAAAPAPVAPAVYDTLIVKNPESDEYGRPKEDLTIVGNIIREDNLRVTVQKPDNTQTSYTFDQVIRILRHTAENPEVDEIQKYAKPLFCPQDMVLVDLPPGKANRPFFKVCIDRYEYPNKQGTIPQVNLSFDDAEKLCENAGKRLCTAQEWRWACSGLEGYAYPYGINMEKENCNTDSRAPEPSGARNKCISKFGVIDMTGNVWEWVRNANGSMAAMGGPVSKCQTVSPGGGGEAKPTIGLRCCKSN